MHCTVYASYIHRPLRAPNTVLTKTLSGKNKKVPIKHDKTAQAEVAVTLEK